MHPTLNENSQASDYGNQIYQHFLFLTQFILVDFYRRLYLNGNIDFTIAEQALRICKQNVLRKGRKIRPKQRRKLEDIVSDQKILAGEKISRNYKNGNSAESGDFVVFEFFKTIMPLIAGNLTCF